MDRSIAEVAPTTEPLDLTTEVKKHVEVSASEGRHDDHLNRLIKSDRQRWEHDTQRATVSRTFVENLSQFPDEEWRFYRRPVTSVTTIKYYDSANAQQTLSSAVYSVDVPNRKIHLALNQTWPTITDRWDAVEITYVAGQSIIDETAKQAMLIDIKMAFDDQMPPVEMEQHRKAYENLVARYLRPNYP